MATRTSSQSGNFNSTATWGGAAVPVDGDQFVVSAGHIVTINDDRRTTNGFHDSTCYGKFHMTGTGKIRMNGQFTVDHANGTTGTNANDVNFYFIENNANTGPYFLMDNGSIFEIKGNNAANHSIRMKARFVMTFEVNGTNPNQTTTISSEVNLGDIALTAASGSGYAAGDWIQLYRDLSNVSTYWKDNQADEGFIVHDVSGNAIYFRHFVSPSATILKSSGAIVRVSDASGFRVGQKVIFGTGSNRNIKTITSIGYGGNRITFNNNIAGSVTGETIYQTGAEKYHYSGDTIQKVATPLTADSNSGTNQITVASTVGMSVGKRILIDANNPSDTGWDYEARYTISAISGNTVTLTTNLANDRKAKTTSNPGGWVVIYDRDTQIRAATIEEDGQASSSEDRPYIYIEGTTNSGAYKRRFRLRNCLFEGIGSNSTNSTWYRGVMCRGYFSYDNNSHGLYASGIEGNVWTPNNSGNNSSFGIRDFHQGSIKRNILYNGNNNLWRYSSGNNMVITANYSTRSAYSTYQIDGFYEPYSEFSYNYGSRSDDYGILMHHQRTGSALLRHNYFLFHEQRPWYEYYTAGNVVRDKNYFDFYRSWPILGTGGNVNWLNCHFGNQWDATGGATSPVNGVQISGNGNHSPDRSYKPEVMTSINHNFKINDTAQWSYRRWRTWDNDENAWKNYVDTTSSGEGGFPESVYIPAGSAVYLAGTLKLSSGFSGSMPALVGRSVNSAHQGRYYDGAASGGQGSGVVVDSYPLGFFEQSAFTSAAASGYERRTLTIDAVNYDYYLTVYIRSTSTNQGDGDEHWFEKPIEIYMQKGSGVKEQRFMTHQQSRRGVNSSHTRRVKRIGGRLK